jgi:hypothetical protein
MERPIESESETSVDQFEKEVLRKLRLICKEFPNPNEEFPDYIFTGGPEYGLNIASSQLSLMLNYGWVEQKAPGDKIRITEAGRKAAQCQ